MTWVNGRIAASVGTADSYVSFPILYLFIFRKTLVAKIRIIFSDQAHSSLKKRGFAKIQNNDEPSTPTGVELQVTAHDTMCGSKCLPNPRPQRRSNLSTDYMVRPRWGRMYRSCNRKSGIHQNRQRGYIKNCNNRTSETVTTVHQKR